MWNIKELDLPSLHSYDIKKIDETNTLDIKCIFDNENDGSGYIECKYIDKNVYDQKNSTSLEVMVIVNEVLKKFGVGTSLYIDNKNMPHIGPY